MRKQQLLLTILLLIASQQLLPVIGQQSHAPGKQQPAEESQASVEAREKLRKLAAKERAYQIGYSPVMERSQRELGGLEIPPGTVRHSLQVRQQAQRKLAEEQKRVSQFIKEHPEQVFQKVDVYELIRGELHKSHPGEILPKNVKGLIALLPAFSWPDYQVMAPVKKQGCSSCWAFSASTALACSSIIQTMRFRDSAAISATLSNGEIVPLIGGGVAPWINYSEEKLINGVLGKGDKCQTGFYGAAFNYMVEHGMFGDNDNVSPTKALTWDYVHYPPDKIPTVMELKTALLEHGPLVVTVHTSDAFNAYRGGVFNEHESGEVDHAVTLIGWDDSKQAWLLQNSWGQEWGIKLIDENWATAGFMWIAWDSNSIGKYAAWVDAKINYSGR